MFRPAILFTMLILLFAAPVEAQLFPIFRKSRARSNQQCCAVANANQAVTASPAPISNPAPIANQYQGQVQEYDSALSTVDEPTFAINPVSSEASGDLEFRNIDPSPVATDYPTVVATPTVYPSPAYENPVFSSTIATHAYGSGPAVVAEQSIVTSPPATLSGPSGFDQLGANEPAVQTIDSAELGAKVETFTVSPVTPNAIAPDAYSPERSVIDQGSESVAPNASSITSPEISAEEPGALLGVERSVLIVDEGN